MNNTLTWSCRDRDIQLGQRTLIMGILNVTPDSFSDGGKFDTVESAVQAALQMQRDGADLIDVGGESTRPGSDDVDSETELDRILPVIEQLKSELAIPISVDTYKSTVAAEAIDAGAVIVNDISGCLFDPDMPNVISKSGAGVVIMHIKGEPKNMQVDPTYTDVIREVCDYLRISKNILLESGVLESKIVVDPGIGFGKRLEDNYRILRELAALQTIGLPVLIGPSRKSFIGNVLNLPPEQRVEGTAAAVTAGILNGAEIVRVHDVKEMKRVAMIADAIAGKH